MEINTKEIVYLAQVMAQISEKDFNELSTPEQEKILRSYRNLIISVAQVLPDEYTQKELSPTDPLLLEIAKLHIFTDLREDELTRPLAEELLAKVSKENVAQLARSFYGVASIFLSLRKQFALAQTLVNFDSYDLDDEFKKLTKDLGNN